MSWRFRKKTKVFPGFYFNFSSRGISTTIGPRGANINIGKKGVYFNQSIRGTGFYNRTKIGGSTHKVNPPIFPSIKESPNQFDAELVGAIKSTDNEKITSRNLKELKQSILDAYKEKIELENLQAENGVSLNKTKRRLRNLSFFLWKWYLKSSITSTNLDSEELSSIGNELNQQLSDTFIKVENSFEDIIRISFLAWQVAFENLLQTKIIWDITSTKKTKTIVLLQTDYLLELK